MVGAETVWAMVGQVGLAFCERLVSGAVYWFSGEAYDSDFDSEEEFESDDDDDDDEFH